MPIQLRAVRYEMVATQSITELNDAVNALLNKGYVPHGDTKIVLGSVQFTYAQAMVKVEPVNINPTDRGSNILVPQ